MQPWTINELMQLTRLELCDLDADLVGTLRMFEAGTVARLQVLASLDNIRRVMTRRGLQF
ncbi:hypothetical protein BjapCC829_18905 [Bradyrhizobium barranii]|uniref:Uncharacterized protein n=1 Tax=Bradyrhizobium barranii TaxID=2992140 RepID=A0ABY3QX96_9BRAD|nr:hypothetical protein [Bradyrhizobium japonicum]UFW90487.1 hypothetical protein BjapCC829_18905 [Bradyrhizobium japonicum]